MGEAFGQADSAMKYFPGCDSRNGICLGRSFHFSGSLTLIAPPSSPSFAPSRG